MELKKKYLLRDRVVRAVTKNGKFRVAVVKSTDTTRSAMEKHQIAGLTAYLLARAISGVALLSSFLKGEERIVLQFDGTGPVRMIYVEALQLGEVRGFAKNAEGVEDAASEVKNLTDALSVGFLKVSKYLYNKFEPITGIVELHRSDITTDLAYYLTQSEQIPSAITLDVLMSDYDTVQESGGLLVQAMPGATDHEIEQMEQAILDLGAIGKLLHEGLFPEEILQKAMPFEYDIVNTSPIDFFCRCSLQRFKDIILTLGIDEVRDMQQSGQNELVCQYCSTKYHLAHADFEEILTTLKAREN
ncbi:MAG: Hsp33 family molecular chaperone HslO [Bacteroidetes bacterium]|nr:Hsp33 family molecular chaperone HslO [Bacteroidota bacterium]